MPIDIDIAYVARLARLDLSQDELDHYGDQLEVILEHAARVQSLATDDVPPTAHALPMTNAFREDEVAASLDREEVLAQAPDREDAYFRVPPALEEEP
jgi:aspartyl-tRNA(Asn)/glutamyl-tRNA(Gln) amidotransferase subunit C